MKMFEEITLKIGTILLLIVGTLMTIMIVACFATCLIAEFKKIKQMKIAKKEFQGKIDPYRIKGDFYKLKGIDCQETDEKKRQLYEVMQNFKEFCKKYNILFNIENLQWYIEIQLMCYKYKEEEK